MRWIHFIQTSERCDLSPVFLLIIATHNNTTSRIYQLYFINCCIYQTQFNMLPCAERFRTIPYSLYNTSRIYHVERKKIVRCLAIPIIQQPNNRHDYF